MKLPTSKRLQIIVEMLEKDGFVNSHELTSVFGVSMETIRKDLLFLEEKGVATKEYGGASLNVSGQERSIEYRYIKEDAKKEIARFVACLMQKHHSLILDSGTTCLACVEYLNLLPSLDIFTNSVSAYSLLNGNTHNVFLTGGKKRQKNDALVGAWAESFLDNVHVDVCILGTAGIMDAQGPTSHSYQEISLKKKMMESADYVYVICDSSKFHEKGLHTICSWDQVDAIITDHAISPRLLDAYKDTVKILVAGEDEDYGKENCEGITLL